MGWDPIGDIKKEVEKRTGGGDIVATLLTGAPAGGNVEGKGLFDTSNWSGWDNPFSNLAREISGQNGGFFNPFELGAQLGDKNAIEWRNKWSNFQGKLSDDLHSNVDNVVGEFGTNKDRQKDWENKVKADAQAAQDKFFQDQVGVKQQADIAGSRAAGRKSNPGARLGKNLNWAANGADVTDFLGL